MNQKQWLVSTDPQKMLGVPLGKISDRKLRLFGIACCRRADPLKGDAFRQPLQMVEAYADGLLDPEELWRIYTLLPDVVGRRIAVPRAFRHWEARDVAGWAAPRGRKHREDRKVQCQLLRDIVGNPFRPVTFQAVWRTPEAYALARTLHDERIWPEGTLDPIRLAVLGDALEDAGCSDQMMLDHCRSPGSHVLGCWVVDAVLGKS